MSDLHSEIELLCRTHAAGKIQSDYNRNLLASELAYFLRRRIDEGSVSPDPAIVVAICNRKSELDVWVGPQDDPRRPEWSTDDPDRPGGTREGVARRLVP